MALRLVSVTLAVANACPSDPLTSLVCLQIYVFDLKVRGVRKITRGITGLWPPSAHSDGAF